MQFTRCPECDTTFRVTDETLKKANGQVRCGRCASVFNAYAELHDPTAKSFEPEAPQPKAAEHRAAAAQPAESPPPAPAPATVPGVLDGSRPSGGPQAQSEPHDAATAVAAASVAGVAAGAEIAAEDAASERRDPGPISATEVERVLAAEIVPPLAPGAFAWERSGEPPERTSRSRWWTAAAVLASLALGAQTVHHFRSDIAGHAAFGPWIIFAYAALGAELTPRWDVQQYRIIDWIATAEPNSRGLGSLKITARIQNRGPLRQPFPAVQLRLKDRWEAALGSRMFTPAEYLPRDAPRGRLMSPGETARAEIEVVDPGPDAYGFELDVCIQVEASLVTCGTDEVFL